MPWAVLLRAANVGGRIFRPSELVTQLASLRITSLGAAGTFAVAADVGADEVRRQIARALPFSTEIMVVPAARWKSYVDAHARDAAPDVPGVRRYVTVATEPVPSAPSLPLYFPTSTGWGVTITHIDGPFLTGWYRRLEPRMIYPNAVIEKEFGVAATTRWWETVVALDEALRVDARGGPSRAAPESKRPNGLRKGLPRRARRPT